MADYYYKLGVSVANESELITALRDFLTHANLGWVESNHTGSGPATDNILLHTKNQDAGNYGYLHIISDDTGATKYVEIHAYPPDYPAFQSPNSFDSPDTSYLPGVPPAADGGNYVEANEYYDGTGGKEHRIDFTFPTTLDMFGDGDTFFLYVSGGSNKYAYMGLIIARQLDHGWVQWLDGNAEKSSIKNGANIRKSSGGTYYLQFMNPVRGATLGAATGILVGFSTPLNTSPSNFIIQAALTDIEASYKEILTLPYIMWCNDEAARGDDITYSGNTYRVVVPGTEGGHDLGVAVLKDTAIT